MRTTTSSSSIPVRFVRRGALAAAVALALVACGSDSDGTVDVPEEGTGSAYNDAIIASESHDEILLNGGDGEIVVAVDCDPETGGTIVTVVAEGLEPAVYTGVFDPSTGVDLTLDATAGGDFQCDGHIWWLFDYGRCHRPGPRRVLVTDAVKCGSAR